ncbi:hypothetical protein GGR39_003239 [Novosphingobium fluoreni]|uniref:Uncharacterized protein n=1 Tax=Novosphingobium fluoreni TaxID=1391222 RepID=A0A7W6C4J9_9SPHN|nr:hypothetical protein [Novosphingobium fluoreni]MBB3941559.1 hypothetical protein [Novosphingobium fluoreni]
MSRLTFMGREPNTDNEQSAGHADEPQRPQVVFPFKLALLAAFCTLLMKTLP